MKPYSLELSEEVKKRVDLLTYYEDLVDSNGAEWDERVFAYERMQWNVQKLRNMGFYVWRQVGNKRYRIAIECRV